MTVPLFTTKQVASSWTFGGTPPGWRWDPITSICSSRFEAALERQLKEGVHSLLIPIESGDSEQTTIFFRQIGRQFKQLQQVGLELAVIASEEDPKLTGAFSFIQSLSSCAVPGCDVIPIVVLNHLFDCRSLTVSLPDAQWTCSCDECESLKNQILVISRMTFNNSHVGLGLRVLKDLCTARDLTSIVLRISSFLRIQAPQTHLAFLTIFANCIEAPLLLSDENDLTELKEVLLAHKIHLKFEGILYCSVLYKNKSLLPPPDDVTESSCERLADIYYKELLHAENVLLTDIVGKFAGGAVEFSNHFLRIPHKFIDEVGGIKTFKSFYDWRAFVDEKIYPSLNAVILDLKQRCRGWLAQRALQGWISQYTQLIHSYFKNVETIICIREMKRTQEALKESAGPVANPMNWLVSPFMLADFPAVPAFIAPTEHYYQLICNCTNSMSLAQSRRILSSLHSAQ